MKSLPPFVKNFIIDAVETGLGLVFALNIALPGSVDEAKAAGVLVASALIAALVSAARRAIPGAVAWLKEQLGVTGA